MRKLKNSELDRKSVDEFKQAEKTPMVVVMDNIRSLNNIGSVFRTSDAFLVNHIYLCGITAKPPHRDIQKTALGATESVNWSYIEKTTEAVAKLQAEGYKVYAIEQAENSTMLETLEINPKDKIAVVFGNEVKGVENDVMKVVDGTLEIQQYGTKHSLNISVCAGIVIWEIFKKYTL